MDRAPVRLTVPMIDTVVDTLASCTAKSDWSIAAASVEATHAHLLLTYTTRDVDQTVKWIKDQATKGIHRDTSYDGPVWCKGKWRTFIFDDEVWQAARTYIEQHNVRRGAGPHPYPFVTPHP